MLSEPLLESHATAGRLFELARIMTQWSPQSVDMTLLCPYRGFHWIYFLLFKCCHVQTQTNVIDVHHTLSGVEKSAVAAAAAAEDSLHRMKSKEEFAALFRDIKASVESIRNDNGY